MFKPRKVPMKVRSVLLLATAALMLPVGGAFVARTGLMSGAAYAEPSRSALNLLAQGTPPDQNPEGLREGKMRHKGMGAQWGKELNLTTEQQAQIKAIRDQEKTASQGLRQQMKTAREKLGTLMAGNADDGQLRQQHAQVQQLSQQLSDRRFDTMLKIRNVLTPEQRTKAAGLMKQHGGRRHGWGERRNESGAMPNAT
jgi:Spy/CpxP family protein refolding chaperone